MNTIACESLASQDGGGAVPRSVFETLIDFSRALHEAGLPVTPGKLIDLGRCFAHIPITERDAFHAACRATLVSRREDMPRFDAVFAQFWEAAPRARKNTPDGAEDDNETESGRPRRAHPHVMPSAGQDDDGRAPRPSCDAAWSPDEVLATRDLGDLSDADIARARRFIRELAAALANARGRRYAARRNGRRPDLRRLLRRRAIDDGLCPLPYRARRINKTRLVLLCDVSGSMQRYSAFLIELMYALRRALSTLQVAVFSTQLTLITDLLRSQGVAGSLKQVAQRVHDWAGGTNIGGCLREFNERHGPHLLNRHSVVILLSDGWDCGEAGVLRDQMRHLRQRAGTLIWLNPLLGAPGYQPLTKGMQTALPFLDHFLPAHNLRSLSQLVRTLQA